MREIKFRAWLPNHKKMYPVLQLSGKFPDEDFQRVFVAKEYVKGEPANYRCGKQNPVMQYTGLKDKNGKEIYEGDYVRIIYKLKEEGVYEVAWNQEHCCFMMGRMLPDNSDADTVYFGNQFDYQYEVVGNIYENPELTDDGNKNKSTK